jgi:hypothetical protein
MPAPVIMALSIHGVFPGECLPATNGDRRRNQRLGSCRSCGLRRHRVRAMTAAAWHYFGIGARTGLSESAGGRHPKRHRGYRQRACCSWPSRTTGTKGRLRPFQQCSAVSRCRDLRSSPHLFRAHLVGLYSRKRLIGICGDVRAERRAASSKTPMLQEPVHVDQDHSAGDMQ